jgi:hypothetical protein
MSWVGFEPTISASKDSSCLRLRGHCCRPEWRYMSTILDWMEVSDQLYALPLGERPRYPLGGPQSRTRRCGNDILYNDLFKCNLLLYYIRNAWLDYVSFKLCAISEKEHVNFKTDIFFPPNSMAIPQNMSWPRHPTRVYFPFKLYISLNCHNIMNLNKRRNVRVQNLRKISRHFKVRSLTM